MLQRIRSQPPTGFRGESERLRTRLTLACSADLGTTSHTAVTRLTYAARPRVGVRVCGKASSSVFSTADTSVLKTGAPLRRKRLLLGSRDHRVRRRSRGTDSAAAHLDGRRRRREPERTRADASRARSGGWRGGRRTASSLIRGATTTKTRCLETGFECSVSGHPCVRGGATRRSGSSCENSRSRRLTQDRPRRAAGPANRPVPPRSTGPHRPPAPAPRPRTAGRRMRCHRGSAPS